MTPSQLPVSRCANLALRLSFNTVRDDADALVKPSALGVGAGVGREIGLLGAKAGDAEGGGVPIQLGTDFMIQPACWVEVFAVCVGLILRLLGVAVAGIEVECGC